MVNLKKSNKIAVLRGGISDEREISILTANQVYQTLQNKYNTVLIDVGHDCKKLVNDLINCNADIVFNCLHGLFGEDGQIQSILNHLQLRYTHSGVLASSIAMNKIISKKIFKSLNICYPKEFNISNELKNSSYPIIIKPVCGGSSNNLIKIENKEQLDEFKIKNEKSLDKFMLEEFINGREITVGILDNEICGVMEIIFDSDVYDFRNKYQEIATHIINPDLNKKITEKLKQISLMIHNGINCKCLSRLDFRYNEKIDEIFLLEINTQPGLTINSLLPEMAKDKGIDFLKLCEIILNNAQCEVI